jgi:hypothetical protein
MYFNNFLRCVGALAIVVAFVTACGGGGGSTPTPTPSPTLDNVLSVTVDTGPAGTG